MTVLQRHPIGLSVLGVAALMAVLIALALMVPMSNNAEHFSGHLALGIPLLFMLVLVWRAWPGPGPDVAGRLARGTLFAGLAVAGVGLLVEAVGAFGYGDDGFGRANALAELHAVGVVLWPVGFVLLMAGVIMTAGALLAERRGAAGSKMVVGSAILAVTAAAVFIVGGFVFGY
jgi:hypothetical protein